MTELTVTNSRMNAIKAGGEIFPPRASTTVEVDDAAAAAIAATNGLTVTAATGKTLRQALNARAKELGIPAKGTNDDLAAAIEAAIAAQPAAPAASAEETSGSATQPDMGDVTADGPSSTDHAPAE